MQVDIELLKEFESGLDPAHPEQSRIPARVLGYGEISTIFEIDSAVHPRPGLQAHAHLQHAGRGKPLRAHL